MRDRVGSGALAEIKTRSVFIDQTSLVTLTSVLAIVLTMITLTLTVDSIRAGFGGILKKSIDMYVKDLQEEIKALPDAVQPSNSKTSASTPSATITP